MSRVCCSSKTVLFVVGIVLTVGGQAGAAVTTFYGLDNGVGPAGLHPNSDSARTSFVSNLQPSTIAIEDFESQTSGSFFGGTRAVSFTPSSVTGTIGDSSTIEAEVHSGAIRGVFPVSGSQFFLSGTSGGSDYFLLEFATPQNAVGFYDVGFSNYYGAGGGPFPAVSISLDDGPLIPIVDLSPTSIHDYSVGFFGVIAESPFTWMKLVNPIGTLPDEGGLDDLIIGRPVPTPAAILLGAVGTGLVGWLRRGRTR